MSVHYDYDLFVIGAGSGGVRAARIAASHGAKVAIAEEFQYGGTCVVRGCIPKKLFVYAAEFSGELEAAKHYGWSTGKPTFDWKTLLAAKDKEISRLSGLYRNILNNFAVDMHDGRATVTGPHSVSIAGKEITANYILVATGGAPFLPEIPGIEHAITSNEAFYLESLPEHITVVGGGYIAVEFASIFRGLGRKVSLIYRRAQVLRGFDHDIRESLGAALAGRGIEMLMPEDITSIEKGGDELELQLKSGGKKSTGAVMYATGRVPHTRDLGLEAVGVELNERGAVSVDDYSKTAVDSIYAVGDCTDRVALTPVAIREGHAFADTVFGNLPTIVDHSGIPSAVFSLPPVGTVGMTEHDARQSYGQIDIYRSTFRPLKKTLTPSTEKIMMKLLVAPDDDDRVVGVHMVGHPAPEIIQVAAVALGMGATKADFDHTIAVHPSTAEELVLMRTKYVPPLPDF